MNKGTDHPAVARGGSLVGECNQKPSYSPIRDDIKNRDCFRNCERTLSISHALSRNRHGLKFETQIENRAWDFTSDSEIS